MILGLVALASLGAASQAPADHAADHVAAVPMIAQAASRDGALAAVLPADAAQKAQSPAEEGLAKTSPALARLLGLGEGIVIGDSNEDEFLDPDVAFVLSAAAGPGAIEAQWDIAQGYYLYRDKFRFRAVDGTGASLGEAGFPKGKIKDDEYFGPMEVYYGSVAARVPVAGAAPGGAIDVDITYQGCADAGLCYPPITKTVSLLLPAALADTGAGAGPGSGASSLFDSDSTGGAGSPDNRTSRAGGASTAPLRARPGFRVRGWRARCRASRNSAPEGWRTSRRSSCRSRIGSPPP